MNKKENNGSSTWIIILIAVIVLAVACFIFGGVVGNGSKDSSDDIDVTEMDDSEDYDNGIEFDEESEGAELKFKKSEKEDFVGSWTATSGQALYLYGNVDIKIKSGGTWTGSVAEEPLQGTWSFNGTTVKLSSDIFEATLSFTDDGKLIMQEDRAGDGELINTVLTEK